MRLAAKGGVPVVARGSGTSLSGGSLPRADGILLALGRMKSILDVDYENGCGRGRTPAVTNLNITKGGGSQRLLLRSRSLQPDRLLHRRQCRGEFRRPALFEIRPFTTNNLLGVVFITPQGEEVRLGRQGGRAGLGSICWSLITGSEGLLGTVVEVTVKILRKAPVTRTLLASFDSVPQAGACVAAIIGDGILPAAMEFMDRQCAEAVEAYNAPGYPKGAAAILIIDADGVEADVADTMARLAAVVARGSTARREATDEAQRPHVVGAQAVAAMGRIQPDMICMDGTIPRKALADVLEGMAALSEKYGLGCCNVFHAGDGNLHPLIVFDQTKPGEFARAEAFGADILRLCVKVGGVLTGEHGVGIEKRDLMPEMFTPEEMEQQGRVKCAFDPGGRYNPGKVFPTPLALHRAGPSACPWRGAAASASAALLMSKVANEAQAVDFVRQARAEKKPFEIVGGGTRRGIGAPIPAMAQARRPVRHRQLRTRKN